MHHTCEYFIVNGDGLADLVLSVPEVDNININGGGGAVGRIYVIFGNDLIFRDGFN